MARHHEKILRWGDKHDGPNNYKNIRRGASEDAFWPEDEPVDHIKAGKKKKAFKKKGCPENDNKGHVYVRVNYIYYGNRWTDFGWVEDRTRSYTIERTVCCGCGKIKRR